MTCAIGICAAIERVRWGVWEETVTMAPRSYAAAVQATGAAALLLTALLGRALNITQGRGSQIMTAPGPDGVIELGGRVRALGAGPLTR